jgi:Zn-dependent protease with chaperone function
MQLAILTAVLAAIASAESGGGPVAGLAWRLVVVATAALVAPLAALLGTHRLAATIAADEESEDAIARLQAGVIAVWLSAVALILVVAQWPQIIRSNWRLAGWPLVDELAILLPVIAPLVLVWAALYRLERAAQLAVCRARQIGPPPPRLLRHLWLQARHHLGLVLLPPLAIVGLFETLSALKIRAVNIDTAWWLAAPLVATILLLMPLAVKRIWRTTSLTARPLRDTLDGVCGERKCGVRDILIWHTDGTMGNAAVVGISRHLRYMLLTDVLLARLSDSQLAAVVRHELGHLRRWHLPLRLALLLLPVAWWLAIKHAAPEMETGLESLAASFGIRPQLAAAIGVPLALLAYAVIVVGWFSRLLEHDADLDACLAADGRIDKFAVDDFCSALTTLCGRSRESRFSQWLHPPVAQRVVFLERALIEPSQAAPSRRRMRSIAIAIVLLYVAAGMLAACC